MTGIDVGLSWDVRAPIPHVLQSEDRTFLAFSLPTPTWDGLSVRSVDATSSEAVPIGVIEWRACRGAILGGPDDEAFHGHRLWSSGLSAVGLYRASEVSNSRWIAELEEANRVQDFHQPESYARLRHFILGFHDSTFECVAEAFRAWKISASMPDVLATLVAHPDTRSDPAFEEVARE